MISTATKYSLDDQMEKNVMGGHVTYMGERRIVYFIFVGGGYLKERDYLEETVLNGIIILKYIFRKWGCGGMEWIELAQDRYS